MIECLLRIEMFGPPTFSAVGASTESPRGTRYPPHLLIDEEH
jgi:hypothetical protein